MKDSMFYQLERVARGAFEAPKEWPSNSVLLASFPKSGNSWFRFVVSNVNALISGETDVSFHTINEYSPVIRGNRSLKDAKIFDDLPIFLKTHFPRTRYFDSVPAVVIVRNPFFVIPSYHDYLQSAQNKKVQCINSFVFHWRYGLNAWSSFLSSWEVAGSIIVKYEDLQSDPVLQVGLIYKKLGFDIPADILREAIQLSSRSSMRKKLENEGDPYNNNGFQFVKNKGDNSGILNMADEILKSGKIRSEFLEQLERYGYR